MLLIIIIIIIVVAVVLRTSSSCVSPTSPAAMIYQSISINISPMSVRHRQMEEEGRRRGRETEDEQQMALVGGAERVVLVWAFDW